ncbi:MAG: glycosyltransferase N-terminal domain-containing protein [Gammaproteobacteria bacterium]
MSLYRLLVILFAPLIVAHAMFKAARFRSWRYFKQRLGYGYEHLPTYCYWLHCASVGESVTAMPLIDELHRRSPKTCFIVTTNTPTGALIIHRQSASRAYLHHAYLPIDWCSAVARFLRHTKPDRLIIIETELWPNLIAECSQRDLNICIANGRLTSRTTIRNRWIRSVYAQTLARIDNIYARNENDARAFIELGANKDKVSIAGNLKFAPPALALDAQNNTRRDYVLVASTHHDEELQIARRWIALERDELLVIAPRHPERSDAILKQLQTLTPAIARRTRNEAITDSTKIYLLDTVGELMGWFAQAKLIIMGGSFVPVGGHNILEAAHFGKGVMFGPHMDNFADESCYLLAQKAALQCDSYDSLRQQMTDLLEDNTKLDALNHNATDAMQPYAKVVTEYADLLMVNQ